MTVKEWLGEEYKLGHDIWDKKYRYKHESLTNWFVRVSGGNEEIKNLIIQKKFIFGGRTLASRGTGSGQSLSNCYSSGYAPDSVEGMLELNKNLALTYKASGGQGLSLSKIRPKGSKVGNGNFESDGIVPFMEIFNQTTASISQGGSRKGALMMSLDIWHPEIKTFISVKDGTGKITKANLSVEIDNEFMNLVKNKVTSHTYLSFGKERTINPCELYNEIMKRAWSSAEPGVIFTDRFRNYNIMQYHEEYEIITSNPCGEQSLPKDGACNLGSMNLAEYVVNPYTAEADFDFDSFEKDVALCISALDEVVDEGMDLHALQGQRDMAFNYRNVGLGVMGVATMMMKLGIVYGDMSSKQLVKDIFQKMLESAVKQSAILAKDKGTFPKYTPNVANADIFKNISSETMELVHQYGLRNCSVLSVAPTGSLGTMLDISTGMEPYYSLSYNRKTESLHGEKDVYYKVEVESAKLAREAFGEDVCVSSMNIDWRDRVDMQGIMQEYVDTAISSTVNVCEDITLEELRDLYLYAWKQGVKGITIYREGSFEAVLSTKEKVVNQNEIPKDIVYYPRTLVHGCGKLKLMVGYSPSQKKVVEVYGIPNSKGGCTINITAQLVYISHILRTSSNLEEIESAIMGLPACVSYATQKAKGKELTKGKSCSSGILNIIKEFKQDVVGTKVISNPCPECGEQLIMESGCNTCMSCGYSKCS